MNTISPFVFDGNLVVRALERDGYPWFIAVDVCNALGISTATGRGFSNPRSSGGTAI